MSDPIDDKHIAELVADPATRDRIVEAVRADLLARSQFGLKKYGRGLDTRQGFTLRDWLHYQYEELLDAANYAKCAIMFIEGEFPEPR